MAKLYKAYNGPMPTTAGLAKVTTGTAIKTLLQLKSVANSPFKIAEWGISFDGSAAGTPILVELIETDVAATVTAFVAADMPCTSDPNGPTSTTYFAVGTTSSGYTATAEGTITATRLFDAELVTPTGPYRIQLPLGRDHEVTQAKFLRVRVTAPVAVNALCDVTVEV